MKKILFICLAISLAFSAFSQELTYMKNKHTGRPDLVITVDTSRIATQYDISGLGGASPDSTVAGYGLTDTDNTISVDTSEIATQYDLIGVTPDSSVYATQYDISLKAPQTAVDTLTGDNELTYKLSLKAPQTAVDTLTGDNELTNKLSLKANQTAVDTLPGDVELTNKLALKADNTAVDSLPGDNELTNKLALKVSLSSMPAVIGVACSDETTALTASTSVTKVTYRMPYAMTVTAVRASVTTAPTGATILVDIHESGTTILSTKIMINATEFTSTTAATPYVIADAALADDAEITVFADQVGSSVAGTGLKIWIIGTRIVP